MEDMFSLKGKNIVATGAGGGLCGVVVRQLASMGANLILIDIPVVEEKLQSIRAELEEKYGVRAAYFTADIADETVVSDIALKTKELFGSVDGLVHAAGINLQKKFAEYTTADFLKVMQINVIGTFCVCKHFGQIMCEQGSGSIVNFASLSARTCFAEPKFMAAYEVSKAAIIRMTQALAVEWGQYNVRVNTISPGYMEAGMKGAKAFDDEFFNQYLIAHTPMKRKVKAEELLGGIIYLLADASTAVTGRDILVDAGYALR